MQLIVILSGPSGVGKDSIIQEIIKKDDNFVIPITMTSRNKRNNEEEAKDYFFVSKSEFQSKINKKELIEFSSTYSDFYGLPKFSMQDALSTGKNVLLRLDTKGTLNLVKQYSNTVSIFISPESIEQLFDQINQRAQDEKTEIEKRMQIAIGEIANANLFDHVVLNEQSKLNETVDIILDLIEYKK